MSHKVSLETVFIPRETDDFEKDVARYFERLNYSVRKTNPQYDIGIPDLFVHKGEESFYVECKKGHDGLRSNQIKWILKHPNEKVLLAIEESNSPIPQVNIDFQLKPMLVECEHCGAEFLITEKNNQCPKCGSFNKKLLKPKPKPKVGYSFLNDGYVNYSIFNHKYITYLAGLSPQRRKKELDRWRRMARNAKFQLYLLKFGPIAFILFVLFWVLFLSNFSP